MNWMLSDPPSHKVGWVQEDSIIKWKWYIIDWALAGPEGTSKLYEEVAKMPTVLLLLLWLLSAAPMTSRGSSYDQLTQEEKTWAWFTDGAAWYAGSTWKRTAAVLQLLSGASLKDSSKVKSSQWTELWSMHLVVHFIGKKSGQTYDYIAAHELWSTVWLDGQRLERIMIKKLVTKNWGEWYVDGPLWMDKKMKTCVSHVMLTKGWP